MKLEYLWQKWNYKPEYEPNDFIRVNNLEEYDVSKILKIMAKLYVISLDENYPWYINPYTIFTPNLLENDRQKTSR